MSGAHTPSPEALADQLDQALIERNEGRWKTIAFVHRHEIAAALRPTHTDSGEVVQAAHELALKRYPILAVERVSTSYSAKARPALREGYAMAITDHRLAFSRPEPVGYEALVERVAGHWDSADGLRMAEEFASKTREELAHGSMPDFALANRMFMAGRDDLDLISWQQAAKDRIRWLSVQLVLARAAIQAIPPDSGKAGGGGQ